MKIGPIRRLVYLPVFPAAFQVLVLTVFVALAVLGWGDYTPSGVNAKLYAKTNLVNLAIWGLWWPAIIWISVLLGRAWCIVCPLEWVSRQGEKWAELAGLKSRPLGGWLAKGALVVVFFAFLQLLVPGVQIHRVPHYTSIFLWTSLGLAFVVGVLFRDRAFCRAFCPVSLLLSAYGRGGMLAVRPANGRCADPQKPAPYARSCPSLLNPARLSSSKDCLVCGACLKADTAGSLRLLLRPPFSSADSREALASWPITLFVMIVSGFVTYELCGVWKTADAIFGWVPQQAITVLNAGAVAGWIKGLWTIVVAPVLIWMFVGAVARLLGARESFTETWRRLALPIAMVVAAGHMAKGLEKFSSWAGYLPYAMSQPDGVDTALKMSAKAMPQPAPWLAASTLSVLSMLLVAAGVAVAVRELRLASREQFLSRMMPIVTLGGFYLFLVFGWGGWLG